MTRPLDGITVVSLEHAIAAPFCTRQLADLGARVIKVERPGGGDFARAYDTRVNGQSSHFIWTNRSKESLTLDLKQPEALAALKQLLAQADVLVQNLAPGAAARMGLSYEDLSASHPQLIVCDISGYGEDGPYRDKKAYDLLIQSEAGLLSVTGTPEEPCKAGNSMADIAAAMYAYTSVLSALLLRGKTGRGSHIDVSMLESLAEWMGFPLYYAFDGAPPPPRAAAAHASIYPYGPFNTRDGTVMLGLQNEREWKVFCAQVLQDAALASDPRFDSNARRNEHRAALKALIVEAFSKLGTAQVEARLDQAQIANARMNDMAGLWAHPQLKARERWRTVGSPAGDIPALLPPGRSNAYEPRMDAVPSVGQHTQAILRELGLGDSDVAALRAAGAVVMDAAAVNTFDTSATARLAAFAAGLRFEHIPEPVVRKIEDLLVDWFGSAVAGHGARPVESITRFALAMGPQGGPSEIITRHSFSSPYLAAMANAAASHVAEQDDVHNGSVFHPATVVFPPALAVAQALGASGAQLLAACVAGYEVGIRVGEFLGRSHYKVFHTTGTAGTLAAAAAVGHLLGLDARQMQHALGSAGTQAAGLWEFLRTAADSKQLHTAHAAGAGLMAAYLAQDGFTGAAQILEGPQGMAAGMSSDADVAKLTAGLGTRWATAETSFKYHASCRHTHPAADALLQVMQTHGLQAQDLVYVQTHVHQGAIDVLGPVVDPATVHQSKFSMGTVLALVARYGHAGLAEFDGHFQDAETQALCARVVMLLDAEVDAAYPVRWIGKVTVHTTDGRVLHGRVDEPKGDPGNTLSRDEINAKALRLAAFSGGASEAEMQAALARLWQVAQWPRVGPLLAQAPA